MTDKQRVLTVYPDAYLCAFGYATGLVHIITDEQGPSRYKSDPKKSPKEAWRSAALGLKSWR